MEFWKMTIGENTENPAVYTAGSRAKLEEILSGIKLREGVTVKIEQTTEQERFFKI